MPKSEEPLLDGGADQTVTWAIANASYKKQRSNSGVTEIAKIPNRGHSLTIDSGWREVADTALAFVKRFVEQTSPVVISARLAVVDRGMHRAARATK